MKFKPDSLALTPLAKGIATALLSTVMMQANAVEFTLGDDITVNFDSTFSVGTSVRTEDRNMELIGKSNDPSFDWSGYNAILNPIYSPHDVWDGSNGSYSTNGDLGNLNHDPGEAFSTLFKGTHELDINAGDFGFFTRFMYFYDNEAKNSKPWKNRLSGESYDLCSDPEAKKQVCQDVRLLDAFAYADFYVNETPISVRLGNQVVSWGESTLISHGINSINPVDIARLKAPGAELKEAFIPVGMLWASVGLTENISFDFFYQYDWAKTILPAPGSYFSTNDFAGDGGYLNNVQIGFTQNPDMDANTLIGNVNGLKGYLEANSETINNLVAAMGAASSPEEAAALAGQFYQVTAPYYGYGTKYAIKAKSTEDNLPKNSGQYGLKLTVYSPELNDTEFGLYYMKYHSRRPVISGQASDFSVAGIASDIQYLLNNNITLDNFHNLEIFTQGLLEYPEDIKLYGLSFNTSIGATALAGEMAYRQDEPLQIDDVELLYAGMPQQLANAGLRTDLNNVSQMEIVQGGEIARGYILRDTMQAQATVTHLFGPMLGADSIAFLTEVGGVYIDDMPDHDVLRLNGPGTARSGPLASGASGLHIALSNGPETNPFPTSASWGYRMVAKATYNNLFSGVNVSPRVVFSHDVNGITPDPMFLFVEDRKSAAFGVNFEYQNEMSADLSYNSFWGGVGTTNNFEDRDYFSLSFKYSI